MNALQAEVLNVLHSNGKDEWTVVEIKQAIESRREDLSDLPTRRDIQRATLALYEAGKANKRRSGSSTSPLIYTASIPDMIIAEPLELFFNWFSSLKFKWICVLCAVVLLPYCGWLAA